MSIHLLNSLQNQYSTKFYVFNKYILRYNGLYLYLYLQKNNLQKVGIIMKKEERRDLSMSVWREQPIRMEFLSHFTGNYNIWLTETKLLTRMSEMP